MKIACLIRVLPYILFFWFGSFYFQISNVSLSLSLCMKLSITRAEIFPPDASVRRLHLFETFLYSIVYTISSAPKAFASSSLPSAHALHPHKECSAQSKAAVQRGRLLGPLRTSWASLPPLRSWFYLGGGKKKSKMQISQHHIHTTWNSHMQSSNRQLMCDFH